MTSSPNPTWYDILGVDRDATPEQIKAAWRSATDKFEPGAGTSQFRLFNEAADVLLDPDKRAAYDAELGSGTTTATETTGSSVDLTKAPSGEAVDVAESDDQETEPAVEQEPVLEQALEPATPAPGPEAAAAPGPLDWLGARLGWIAAVCVPLLVAAIVAGLVSVFGLHVWKADVQGVVPASRTFDAGPDASAVAERALKAVLSYDYRHMTADRDRAAQFLTPKYKKDYLKTFNELLTKGPDGSPGPVEKTKAVVTADVLNTGIVDAEENRVRVIAFVNQSSVKGDGQPTVFQNRVVATMVRRDGDWLIDNLTSY